MRSQVRFVMHPLDERDFEQLLLADESVRFIAGPRWAAKSPQTTRSLAEIDGGYCIVWSTSDLWKLTAEYIPACHDWYCNSEYATIQFLRSEIHRSVITEGRIAVSTVQNANFSASSMKSLEKRYVKLRNYIKQTFSNSTIQWRNPKVPDAPAGPNRSANPSKPDPQLWVGPHALHWLQEKSNRKIKQFREGAVEGVLVTDSD